MFYSDFYSKLTIQQIEFFLETAKYQSITKAAESMHFTHSALSKSLSKMEKEMGLCLFIRDRQRLKLTPAGNILQKELSLIMSDMEQAFMKAHFTQQVESYPVRIGLPIGVSYNGYLNSFLAWYRQEHSDFTCYVDKYPYPDLANQIRNRTIDMAFSFGFNEEIFTEDIVCVKLFACPWTAYMHKTNPLSKKSELEFNDIKGCRFLLSTTAFSKPYVDTIMDLCRKNDIIPQIYHYMNINSSPCINIRQSDEIFIADPYVTNENPEVVSRPLKDESTYVVLAYRDSDITSDKKELIETVIDYYRNIFISS